MIERSSRREEGIGRKAERVGCWLQEMAGIMSFGDLAQSRRNK
jgi:hypothetical protein